MPSDPPNSVPPDLSQDTTSRAIESDVIPKDSYGEIIESSAMIGGSSLLSIAIGVIRTKVMAVMLGPGGFGLMGMYGSIADLAAVIAGMGLNSSGVRQIAEAVGSRDTTRIAKTVTALRRTATFLGIVGAVFLLALSAPISTLTFGSDQHAGAVALLSIFVFFRLIADSQGAQIQGMRRVADLAKMAVLGGILVPWLEYRSSISCARTA